MPLNRSRAPVSHVEAQGGAPGWRLVLGRLLLCVTFPDFKTGLAFVNAVGQIAERLDHHPDVDLRWGRVVLSVHSHDVNAITSRDVEFARAVDEVLPRFGGQLDHARATSVEIAIDTVDADRIRPFWAAVLGYVERGGELHDPTSRGPAVWFQEMTEPRTERNRIHIDVSVAHDEAELRIQAALAAGGTLLSDEQAPMFWVLADADGNEACVSTWQGRDR